MRIDNSKTIAPYESNVNKPLILDLIGPTVIHLYKDRSGVIHAGVYAPPCEDHHANLLTDSNDLSMESRDPSAKSISYQFQTSSAPTASTSFTLNNSGQILLISNALSPVQADQCHMTLSLPCPDQIWPLIPEGIWIHKNGAGTFVSNPDNDPNIVNSKRARGVRFVYYTCNGAPVLVQTSPQKPPVDLSSAIPDALGVEADPVKLPHYKMTVRFASNRATGDEHHEDAFNCFLNLRNMLDNMTDSNGAHCDACTWRVDFSDIPAVAMFRKSFLATLTGPRPNDCGSGTIFVQDPGIGTYATSGGHTKTAEHAHPMK